MTAKRFYIAESNLIDGYCVFDREKKYVFSPRPRKADCLNDAHILNELHEQSKMDDRIANDLLEAKEQLEDDSTIIMLMELKKENKQLKQELGSFKPIIFETENGATTLYEKRGLND